MKIGKIIIIEGDTLREISLNKDIVLIGRGHDKSPDIVLSNRTVSRLHAKIFKVGNNYFIEDLSTYKRTYVNNHHITLPTEIKDNDIIYLGEVKLKFKIENVNTSDFLYNERHELIKEEKVERENKSSEIELIETKTKKSKKEEIEKEKVEKEEYIDEIEEARLSTQDAEKVVIGEVPFASIEKSQNAEILFFNKKQIFSFNKNIIYIGKDKENDIIIEDNFIEKSHIAIIYNEKEDKYYIKKIGENEVRVDGKPLENIQILKDASIIEISSYIFFFFDGSGENLTLEKLIRKYFNPTEKVIEKKSLENLEKEIRGDKIYFRYEVFKKEVESESNINYIFFHRKIEKDVILLFLAEIVGENIKLEFKYWFYGIFDQIIKYTPQNLSKIINNLNKNLKEWLPPDVYFKGISLLIENNHIKVNSFYNPPIIYYNRVENNIELIYSKSIPLGINENFYTQEKIINFNKGDILFVFTSSLLNSPLKITDNTLCSLEICRNFLNEILEENNISSCINYNELNKIYNKIFNKIRENIIINNSFIIGILTLPNFDKLICPKCNAVYPLDYKFCPKDGYKLS